MNLCVCFLICLAVSQNKSKYFIFVRLDFFEIKVNRMISYVG